MLECCFLVSCSEVINKKGFQLISVSCIADSKASSQLITFLTECALRLAKDGDKVKELARSSLQVVL